MTDHAKRTSNIDPKRSLLVKHIPFVSLLRVQLRECIVAGHPHLPYTLPTHPVLRKYWYKITLINYVSKGPCKSSHHQNSVNLISKGQIIKKVVTLLGDELYLKGYFAFKFHRTMPLLANATPRWQCVVCDRWQVAQPYRMRPRALVTTTIKPMPPQTAKITPPTSAAPDQEAHSVLNVYERLGMGGLAIEQKVGTVE